MKTPTLFRSLRSTCMALLAGIQIAAAQCPTSLTVTGTSNSNGDVIGTVTLNNPPAGSGVYFWSLYDGTNVIYYNSTSSTHTFVGMPSASYSLCASYNDSINACTAYGNCSLLSVVNTNSTSCHAAFTYHTDSLCSTYFYNQSTGFGLGYQWSDNGTVLSTQQNPYLTLGQGTHYITLFTTSSGVPCDSVTQQIYVSCSGTVTPCNASFTYYTDSNCVTHFVNTSTGTNLTYAWYDLNNSSQVYGGLFGGGQANPTFTVSNGDNIALYVSSNGQFCDSANVQVSIACNGGNPSGNCNAGFWIFADSTNAGNYFAYNTSTGTGLSYLWDFGDGTTSTQQYPFHQYAVTGHYVVCLTVTGTNSCTSTYCDSSSVHKTASMGSFHVIPQTVTGIQSQEIVKTLKAYPNPMTDELTIEVETATRANLSYTLTDGLGRTIVKNDISDSSLKINTASLDKGFYFLSVSDKNGKSLKTIKLLK